MDNMELINNPQFIYSYKSPVGLFFIRYNPYNEFDYQGDS